MKRNTNHKSLWVIVAVAFLQMTFLFTPCASQGADLYWVGGSDNWGNSWFVWDVWPLVGHTATNWSTNGLPDQDDNVYITASGYGATKTITYDLTWNFWMRHVEIDGSSDQVVNVIMTGHPDYVKWLVGGATEIGITGIGRFTQEIGRHHAGGGLTLGKTRIGVGTYILSDTYIGQTSELYVTGPEYIGDAGTGSFFQSGGWHFLGGSRYLGYSVSIIPSGSLTTTVYGRGTYTMSAGTCITAYDDYIGYSGTGTFTQSGGDKEVMGNLYLGYKAGSSGTYTLSGTGTLSAANEHIGWGSFTQRRDSNRQTNSLRIAYGELALRELRLGLPEGVEPASVKVGGKDAGWRIEGGQLTLDLGETTLGEGDELIVETIW